MLEEQYIKAINALKEKYPQFAGVRFDISDGVLGYMSGAWSLIDKIDISELQRFVNEFLGQKVYQVKYVAYSDIYARSKEEAMEFSRRISVVPTSIEAIEVTQNK